jgi:hypothetical protein
MEHFFSSRRREGISCKVKPEEQGMTEIRTPQAFCVG